MPVSSEIPPHNLGLVIDFVNTFDVESQRDALAGPAELTRWLRGQGLLEPAAPPLGESELARARELRAALRTALRAHTSGNADGEAATTLQMVAERGRLSVGFELDGTIRVGPRADGHAGALAHLLVPIVHATVDGTWLRVKACGDDTCQEAFYDASRNRSGRWCDMALCGNRSKVRAYRSKRGGP
ncbi:MAG: CGNR zinc finger domain-containing protein [Solirubrobacteraceae bacterium]